MSWLSNITPPGIKNIFNKPDNSSDTLWEKCKNCGEMIFHRDLEASHRVCSSCGYHMSLDPADRLKLLMDDQDYTRIDVPESVADPLKFRDTKKYMDRLKDHRKRTGEQDALVVASGAIDGLSVVVAVQNFSFMGGSMGIAVGEAFLKAAETAVEQKAPLIVFTASGGARMQESILALMQMPRTTIAVEMLRDAGLPFIVVLTNPTTGGVMASFAMLGDVHMAEPGAVVGFAGRRVIEQTIRETLPDEFQTAEFVQDKGMIDMVVHRHDLRPAISRLLRVLMHKAEAASIRLPESIDEPSTELVAGNDNDDDQTDTSEIAETSESALDKAAE